MLTERRTRGPRTAGACVIALWCACRSESKPTPPPTTTEPPIAVAPSPAPAPSSPPTEASRASVKLPAKGFDVTRVIGRAKTDVDKELGKGEQLEDGPWAYGAFEGVGITVLFDSGKAALVTVEPADYRGAPADLAAINAWIHAPADADYDHVHNFDSVVSIWAPGMQQRQLDRRELAQKLTETLRASSAIAAANGTDLEISAAPGKCNRGVLRSAAASVGGVTELKRLGFAMMECAGEENTEIRL